MFVLLPGSASAVTLSLAGYTGAGVAPYSTHTLNGAFDLDNNAAYASYTDGQGVAGQTVHVLDSGVKSAANGLYVDGPAYVTYTYLGKEAAFTNRLKFAAGDTTVFNSNTAVLGDTSGPFLATLAGLLEFKLTSEGDSQFAFNNATASSGMNIAYMLLSTRSALIFLDDFGAGPDRDFDDIGIRIDIAAVPLPAGVALLGSGLAVLGVFGWRRRRAAGSPV